MTVAELAASLKLASEDIQRGAQQLDDIARKVQSFASAAEDKLKPVLERTRKAFEDLVKLETVKQFAEIVSSTVELGSKLSDAAQKAGISVEALQRLGFVAKLNSSSTDEFAKGITKLATGLDETGHKAGGATAEALGKLGISIRDTTFQGAALDEKVQMIAEKLALLPDGGTKTALAMSLFGDAGANLIPTLNELGKHGDELRTQFDAMGGGLSGKQTEALDQFGKGIERTKIQFGMLEDSLVAQLIPSLQELLTAALAWIDANRDLVSSTLHSVVEGLAIIVRVLGAALDGVLAVLGFFLEHAELAKSVLTALGIVFGVLAVQAAAAWAAAFAPVIAVIAAVTAIVLLVRTLIAHADDIKSAIGGALQWIADQAREFWEGLQAIGRAIGEFFANLGGTIAQEFGNALASAWLASADGADKLWGTLSAGGQAIANFFTGIAGAIRDAFRSTWIRISDEAGQLWGNLTAIFQKVADFFSGIAASIEQAFVDAFDWIVAKAKGIGDALLDLPVIKQLVEFGHWLSPGGGDDAGGTTIRPDAMQAGDDRSRNSTVTFGNTNLSIHVTPGNGDPQEIASKIQQAIADHHAAQMREAHAATGGADMGSQ